MTRILVVRHGQSEWNATGRWQGQEDPPLTELGRRQASEAAAALGALDAVVASPLQRAAVTASVIAEQLGIGPVVATPGLMERHAGEWQGLTRDEIEARYPGYLAQRLRPPGWEDDAAVERRVFDALEQVATELAGGTVLAVAHAGVIYAIEQALGAEWERLGNLAGRWIERRDQGWSIGDRVHLLAEETVPNQL